MRIGIDIDDTLTDIKDLLWEQACIYTKSINKQIPDDDKIKNGLNGNMSDFYKMSFGWTDEELIYFFRNERVKVIDEAIPRKNVKEVLDKLKQDEHEIYIITARAFKFDDIPYERAKNWLDKNKLTYDKLIVNAIDKAKICLEERIDIFIDDQLNNCLAVSNEGIPTIRFIDKSQKCDSFVSMNDWQEIYEYINKELKNK